MKKRLAIILTAVLLLCTFTPLCFACSSTRDDAAVVDSAAKAIAVVRRFLPCLKPNCGMFTFTVYGKGHGVGMSQLGAIAYAQQGRSYDRILLHYYPGVSLERETPPASVTYNGITRDTEDFLVRAVQQEIGGSTVSAEAYKAQAVAVYSLLKAKNYALTSGEVSCSAAARCRLSAAVRSAVRSVLGQYMSYAGEAVNAVFFAGSAGKTTDSRSVWGTELPYLTGGADSPETVSVSASAITAKGLRSMVLRYNASHPEKPIILSGDPSQWLEIVSHDGARGDVGYVASIRVGDTTMSGNTFRTLYNLYRPYGTAALRSHCFSIRYA
ncbi:MAG: hypothetical protein IJT44_07600 [Clostridia bacterium]|nr:hypothetical protein [Clostridia bacterium]